MDTRTTILLAAIIILALYQSQIADARRIKFQDLPSGSTLFAMNILNPKKLYNEYQQAIRVQKRDQYLQASKQIQTTAEIRMKKLKEEKERADNLTNESKN